jgi:hypothetical protein
MSGMQRAHGWDEAKMLAAKPHGVDALTQIELCIYRHVHCLELLR